LKIEDWLADWAGQVMESVESAPGFGLAVSRASRRSISGSERPYCNALLIVAAI
jgi:hypothetical protein